jgi:hypothetical protein
MFLIENLACMGALKLAMACLLIFGSFSQAQA